MEYENEIFGLKKDIEHLSKRFESDSFIKARQDAKAELKETMDELFIKGDFTISFRKFICSYIDEKINIKLQEKNLFELIRKRVDDVINSHLSEAIKRVVEKIVSVTHKKLKWRYDIMHELCSSIDSEIKHTLMKLPCSPSTEEKVMEMIETTTKELSQKAFVDIEKKLIGELKE